MFGNVFGNHMNDCGCNKDYGTCGCGVWETMRRNLCDFNCGPFLFDSTENNIESLKRVREFYAMTPESAYDILEGIAEINGLTENLYKVPKSKEDIKAEEMSQEISEISEEKHIKNNPNVSKLYNKLKTQILYHSIRFLHLKIQHF